MFATNDNFWTSKLDPATGLILICQTGIKNVYTIDINDLNNNNRNSKNNPPGCQHRNRKAMPR